MASLSAGVANLPSNAVDAVVGAGEFLHGFIRGGYPISTERALVLLTLTSGVAGGLMNLLAAQRLEQVEGRFIDANQMFWAVIVSFVATFAAGAVLTPNSATDTPVGSPGGVVG